MAPSLARGERRNGAARPSMRKPSAAVGQGRPDNAGEEGRRHVRIFIQHDSIETKPAKTIGIVGADGGHSRKETGKAAVCGIFLGDFAVIERFSNLGMTDDQLKIIGSIGLNWSIVEVEITDIL